MTTFFLLGASAMIALGVAGFWAIKYTHAKIKAGEWWTS